MDKLKPCPFCGGEAVILGTMNFESLRRFYATCLVCGVESQALREQENKQSKHGTGGLTMREILFRGKRKDNGEWVYWNIYGEFCTSNGRRIRLTRKTPYGEKYYYYIYEIKQLIDPSTAGQYTGLTDKNGKIIFDGDIVKHYNHNPIKEYSEDTGRVFWYNPTQRYLRTSSLFPDDCPELFEISEYEVIGNIYDNPELLKGGAKNE